jgi:GST-like protein
MIELYTWDTPNGRKVHIALEELELAYTVHRVNLGAGEQHAPSFLEISPNGKIPAIVDHDGPGSRSTPVFESGAILLYLAERTGRLLPANPIRHSQAIQWLMFQMAGIGPMVGQLYHFRVAAPDYMPYAVDRFTAEVERLLGVMERRLERLSFLAAEYSIADIACYPWVHALARLGLEPGPNVKGWLDAIGDRPAVRRGMALLAG